MIIKNIFRVRVHPFFYVIIFILCITGQIRAFLLFFTIIIVHELGHIIVSILFGWRINYVMFLPFGCLTVFDNPVNTSFLSEIFVTFAGPMFQIIFSVVVWVCFDKNISVLWASFLLLVFNLIPIYPMDGSKIFNALFNLFFSFKTSYYLTFIFSLILSLLVFVFSLYDFNLFFVLVSIILIFNTFRYVYSFPFIFNKFLYERYKNTYFFHLCFIIEDGNLFLMRKWRKHLFLSCNSYVTEKYYLKKRFDNSDNIW